MACNPQLAVVSVQASDLVSSLNVPKLVILPFTADTIIIPASQPPAAGNAVGQVNTGQGGNPGNPPFYALRLNTADNAEIMIGGRSPFSFQKFLGSFTQFYVRLIPGYATPAVPLFFYVSKAFDMKTGAEIYPSGL